jgi:vacuolar-type H+-ATPase subunit E/Vma4
MTQNAQLKDKNCSLSKIEEQLNETISRLEENIKELKEMNQTIWAYLDLLGIQIEDFKRNFNEGLLYIIKPGSHK